MILKIKGSLEIGLYNDNSLVVVDNSGKEIALLILKDLKKITCKTGQKITLTITETRDYKKEEEEISKSWRYNYDIYLSLVKTAKIKILTTPELFKRAESVCSKYQNIDIPKSLDYIVETFWGTPDGWKYKKNHCKDRNIDMVQTLINNSWRPRIYKPFKAPEQAIESDDIYEHVR